MLLLENYPGAQCLLTKGPVLLIVEEIRAVRHGIGVVARFESDVRTGPALLELSRLGTIEDAQTRAYDSARHTVVPGFLFPLWPSIMLDQRNMEVSLGRRNCRSARQHGILPWRNGNPATR